MSTHEHDDILDYVDPYMRDVVRDILKEHETNKQHIKELENELIQVEEDLNDVERELYQLMDILDDLPIDIDELR